MGNRFRAVWRGWGRKICSTRLSVRDNVALGARLRGEKVDRARVAALLEQVELSSCADARPATLRRHASARALARTLYEDRPIVLMDEPFSALDTLTRTRIQTRRPPCWPVARWCLSPTIRRRPAG